ncbi:hypothetical protein T11_10195 [Trichinella zimbabwensis]|uniref:Uncharacterized protein n=1 Tax=Trichinella zimbabwensis TaxID=268475 RepID=A0A0V1HR93_9BILA|nr:hypothetical protein T11_10195 [Trichinella zimbabwensis]
MRLRQIKLYGTNMTRLYVPQLKRRLIEHYGSRRCWTYETLPGTSKTALELQDKFELKHFSLPSAFLAALRIEVQSGNRAQTLEQSVENLEERLQSLNIRSPNRSSRKSQPWMSEFELFTTASTPYLLLPS